MDSYQGMRRPIGKQAQCLVGGIERDAHLDLFRSDQVEPGFSWKDAARQIANAGGLTKSE
jgi:hypothetical protein